MLGFASSTLYCPLFLNLAKIGHQVSNAQSFSVCTGGLRNQGICLRSGLGVNIFKPLLRGSVSTIFLKNLNLGCTEIFVWLQLEGEEYLGCVLIRGWCCIKDFFWGFMAILFWGQASQTEIMSPAAFFSFPTEIRNFTLFLLMVCLIFKELERFGQMLLC